MNCKDFEKVVGDLADEQLMEASKYKLALAHKNSCAPCAARLANERSLTKALQVTASAETEQASAHTKAALLKAFAERTLPSPAPRALSVIEVAPLNNPYSVAQAEPAVVSGQAAAATVTNLSVAPAPKPTPSRWTWVAAAAVLIALLTIAALSFLQPHQAEPQQEAGNPKPEPVQPQQEQKSNNELTPVPETQNPDPQPVAEKQSAPARVKKRVSGSALIAANQSRTLERSNEVTTDYIPLSYVSDATAMESGHVVRMMVARSTLISMGLPMNVERDKEMVKADVVVGDDGLARAIRFVYSETQHKSR